MTTIQLRDLTKTYGDVTAVDHLTVDVRPGAITGFLGPNGAGKTTTMRMLLGLVRPTSGTATFGGVAYADLDHPARTVGALLDPGVFHPGHRGRSALRIVAAATGVPDQRVEEVLDVVGLADAARRRVGGYSMGMRQRLALAGALLGDPETLVLDEPSNGLDPEGMRWLRGFLKRLAAEGRTVLVSSHVLSEMAQTVSDVVVIHRGKVVKQGPVSELTGSARGATIVRSPEPEKLTGALRQGGAEVSTFEDGALNVQGMHAAAVGDAALAAGVAVHQLYEAQASLEDVFFELTGGEAAT
jgi:ABC-2 type transport system ATP-binding protein